MKKVQVRFLTIILVSMILVVSSQSFAQIPVKVTSLAVTNTNYSSFFNTIFWQRVTVAVISGALGFLSAYVLAEIGKKQGSGKRLSYATVVEKGLVTIEKGIKEKVKVLYEGEEIEDLYHVRFDVENTGKTVIKAQDIRFEFAPETRILDSYLDPTPQPEMKVEMIGDPALKPHEKKYRIGHIERNQSVGFRFTVTSKKDVQVELHPFNESGDVDVSSRSVIKVEGEKEKVTKFITLLIMYIVIPQVIDSIDVFLGGFTRLIIFLFLFPLIVPFSKSVSNIIYALSDEVKRINSMYYNVTNNVSIDAIETGHVRVGDVKNQQYN